MNIKTGGFHYKDWSSCFWLCLTLNERKEFIFRLRLIRNFPDSKGKLLRFCKSKRKYENDYSIPTTGYSTYVSLKTKLLVIDFEYYDKKINESLPVDEFLKELQDAGYE